MPVRCPHCQVPLTRDEAAAESCPACGGSLKDAPAAEETVREGRPTPASRGEFEEPRARPARREFDDDDFDDRPIRRAYGSGLESGWRTTQAGINTMFWGFMTVIISVVVGFALILLAVGVVAGGGFAANNPGGVGAALGLPACLMILGVIGGLITYLVGMFMCLTAPDGKAWMGGSLAFVALVILIFAARFVIVFNMTLNMQAPANPDDTPVMKALNVGMNGTLFLLSVFLTMFCKRIAQSFGNSFLNVISNVFLGFVGVYVALAIAIVFIVSGAANPFLALGGNRGGGLGQLGAIILGLVAVFLLVLLVGIVLHAIMLRSARNTIARAGAGPDY